VQTGSDRRADVLRVIALDGPIPRSRIAESVGISAGRVTAITRELLESGLVEMSGKAPAAGPRGRPLEMLSVVPDAAVVVGSKVAADHLTAVVTDLRGEIVQRFSSPFTPTGQAPAQRVAEVLAPALAEVAGRLVGVGLGVPGTVAADEAGSVTSPMLGWRRLPLGALVSEHLGVPVVVDNDVNTLAVAESLYGSGLGVANFLTITVGRGIGLGVFLDGQLRRGRGGAGELGHTLAVADGPVCDCGRCGCLEAVAAEPALVAAARARQLIDADAGIDALRMAAASSPAAADLFADAGTHIGRAVADLVNLFAPDRVIVSGEGVAGWSLLADGFSDSLRTRVLEFHADVPVVIEPWADDSWAQGAAALVLGSLFAPTNGEQLADQLQSRLHTIPVEVPA
jgi:predicted NBD/HSP70 family sugar kinase